jgi:hypothetical protein
MATYTTRNDLIKPEYTDAADIEDLNDNMDFIDGSIAPCTWDATTAPTANDDVTLGYIIGSMWFDVTNHKLYMCEDNTDTAAVWRLLYPQTPAGVLLADGTVPLTADWDAGSYEIRAQTFESDVATGTAPFVVASTTKVNNLNAATVNGHADTAFLHADGTVNATATINSTLAVGTAPITVTSTTKCTNLNADKLDDLNSTDFAILAGQSGGQTLYGGTASGNSLNLYATSHATKGYVNLPEANLVLGTKATTAPNFAMAIHEGAAGAANPIQFIDGDGSTAKAGIFKDSSDNLCLASGDGTTTDFYVNTSGNSVAVGSLTATGLVTSDGLNFSITETDPAAYSSNASATTRVTYTGSESVSETYYAVYDAVFPEIRTSHTNSGSLYAYYTECMRNHNAAGTDDDGTLTSLYALRAAYGHYNINSSMKGTTTNAAGLYVTPYCVNGTITNLIGIRIVTPTTGGTITNQWPIYSDWNAQHYFGGDIYTTGNCSALTFTDRTPWYEGDGIEAIKKMKGKNGKLDHDSFPDFAKKTIEGKPKAVKKGKKIGELGLEVDDIEVSGKEVEVGRDLGATVTILVKAVQQLSEENNTLKAQMADAIKRIEKLEKKA